MIGVGLLLLALFDKEAAKSGTVPVLLLRRLALFDTEVGVVLRRLARVDREVGVVLRRLALVDREVGVVLPRLELFDRELGVGVGVGVRVGVVDLLLEVVGEGKSEGLLLLLAGGVDGENRKSVEMEVLRLAILDKEPPELVGDLVGVWLRLLKLLDRKDGSWKKLSSMLRLKLEPLGVVESSAPALFFSAFLLRA